MITETSKIKILRKLDVTDLAGEKVMIDFNTGKYFLLKGVANDIWDCLKEDVTINEIKNTLLSAYEVDETTCLESIIQFLKKIKDYGFIELIN